MDLPRGLAMTVSATKDSQRAIGRSPERLSPNERRALMGKYVALEIYTPEDLPLRRIKAIGDSVQECVRQPAASGLNRCGLSSAASGRPISRGIFLCCWRRRLGELGAPGPGLCPGQACP